MKIMVCQGCGQELASRDDVICIRYGRLSRNMSVYAIMGFPIEDYYHIACRDRVGIRDVKRLMAPRRTD